MRIIALQIFAIFLTATAVKKTSTIPSKSPSKQPTKRPSIHPTKSPSLLPLISLTSLPTAIPSAHPSFNYSYSPSISGAMPSAPSERPPNNPSKMYTFTPTDVPTQSPSKIPNNVNAKPSENPSPNPSLIPSSSPTFSPSRSPTFAPIHKTQIPTHPPSKHPSYSPSIRPTNSPTRTPNAPPTLHSVYSLGVSEVVTIPTMGGFDASQVPPQQNCPHLQPGLPVLQALTAGSNVVIPPDIQILLTTSSLFGLYNGIVNRITISNQSSLIFDDINMNLHVKEIVVNEGGKLVMGSPSCRILSSINITFHGSLSTSSLNDPAISSQITATSSTSKGLLVYGEVQLHGKYYRPTWTRLAITAKSQDYIVFLQEPVNWDVGMTVLITPTIVYDCPVQWNVTYCQGQPHQNELRVITTVYMDTANRIFQLSLDKPLTYYHYAGVEYQAEIALLTRNILFQGSQSRDYFGCHIKVFGPQSLAQISSVQADQCGQLNILARYPFHFHMKMESPQTSASYFEDCSVTNSYFRCYTVHGTNNTRLSRNVAFNAIGMCYYFENGVEENNLVEYNLAAHVHPIYKPANGPSGSQDGETFASIPGKLLIPADTSASGFYFLNAMNTIIGNAASGGWSGYAFPNAVERQGLFRGTLPLSSWLNPWNRPLKKFYGNTAHSTGFYWTTHGSAVYVGGWLEYDQTNNLIYTSGRSDGFGNQARNTYINGSTPGYFSFEQTKVFLSTKGISHWGDDVKVVTAEIYDTLVCAMLFGQATLYNVLVDVQSANPYGTFLLNNDQKIGFQFYDTAVQTILSNVTFRHLSKVSNTACTIRYTDFSDVYTNQGINAVINVKFESVNDNYRLCLHNCGPETNCTWDLWYADNPSMSSKLSTVYDFDGSILNTNEPTILGSHENWWQNDDGSCSYYPNLNYWSCPWTFKPLGVNHLSSSKNFTVGYMDFRVPGLTLEWGDVCSNSFFPTCTGQFAPYTVMRLNHWGPLGKKTAMTVKPARGGGSGLTNMGWYLRVQAKNFSIDGAPSFFYTSLSQLVRGSFIVLAISYPPQAQFSVTVSWWGGPAQALTMSARSTVLAVTENLVPSSEFTCPEWGSVPNYGTIQCMNTGGSGLTWHFDGTYFYLRMVQFNCYIAWAKDYCADSVYHSYGATIGDLIYSTTVSVNVTSCPGCVVQKSYGGINYYVAPDIIPPQTLEDFVVPLPVI